MRKKKDEDFPSLPAPISTNVMPSRTKQYPNNNKQEEKKASKLNTEEFPSLRPRNNPSPNSSSSAVPREVARVIQLTSTPTGPLPSFPGVGGVGRGKPKNTQIKK